MPAPRKRDYTPGSITAFLLRIPGDVVGAVDDLADAHGRSRNAEIIHAIREYVTHHREDARDRSTNET